MAAEGERSPRLGPRLSSVRRPTCLGHARARAPALSLSPLGFFAALSHRRRFSWSSCFPTRGRARRPTEFRRALTTRRETPSKRALGCACACWTTRQRSAEQTSSGGAGERAEGRAAGARRSCRTAARRLSDHNAARAATSPCRTLLPPASPPSHPGTPTKADSTTHTYTRTRARVHSLAISPAISTPELITAGRPPARCSPAAPDPHHALAAKVPRPPRVVTPRGGVTHGPSDLRAHKHAFR